MIALIHAWVLTLGWDIHHLAERSPVFTWITHGLLALPIVLLVRRVPWAAPGAVFAYRELEQMWFRFLNDLPMLWGDHFMDVAIPTVVGWLFLHRYEWGPQ